MNYNKLKIIAISGKQGSGKSSLGENIFSNLNFDRNNQCMFFKFADVLYEMHGALKPILTKYNLWPAGQIKDGELLQCLGTEYGIKKFGTLVWVNILLDRITKEFLSINSSFPNDNFIVVIDDLRFVSELQTLIAGFPPSSTMTIRLEADESSRRERCSYWRDNTEHISEIDLDKAADLNFFNIKINTDLYSKQGTLDIAMSAIRSKLNLL